MSDPGRALHGLRQPDRLSCGATTVVGWRVLTDPAYVARVRGSEEAAVLATHRRLVALRDEGGRLQVPWPRALGTPPWALARAVEGRVVRARWASVEAAVSAGRPVPLYVGNRWCPLHVVLVVARDGDDVLGVHDPARGGSVRVTREQWEHHHLPFTGRGRAWWAVIPADPSRDLTDSGSSRRVI